MRITRKEDRRRKQEEADLRDRRYKALTTKTKIAVAKGRRGKLQAGREV